MFLFKGKSYFGYSINFWTAQRSLSQLFVVLSIIQMLSVHRSTASLLHSLQKEIPKMKNMERIPVQKLIPIIFTKTVCSKRDKFIFIFILYKSVICFTRHSVALLFLGRHWICFGQYSQNENSGFTQKPYTCYLLINIRKKLSKHILPFHILID